jgi:hypothetical protein
VTIDFPLITYFVGYRIFLKFLKKLRKSRERFRTDRRPIRLGGRGVRKGCKNGLALQMKEMGRHFQGRPDSRLFHLLPNQFGKFVR